MRRNFLTAHSLGPVRHTKIGTVSLPADSMCACVRVSELGLVLTLTCSGSAYHRDCVEVQNRGYFEEKCNSDDGSISVIDH